MLLQRNFDEIYWMHGVNFDSVTHTYTCIYVAFKFTVSGYGARVAVYFTLFIEEAAVVCISSEIIHIVLI